MPLYVLTKKVSVPIALVAAIVGLPFFFTELAKTQPGDIFFAASEYTIVGLCCLISLILLWEDSSLRASIRELLAKIRDSNNSNSNIRLKKLRKKLNIDNEFVLCDAGYSYLFCFVFFF